MDSDLIMLVADDNNLRQSFKLILKHAGYSVTATECTKKAINMIQSGHYQLVITDRNKLATGEMLLPQILGKCPDMSIVILTDQSSADLEKDNELTRAYFLSKPLAPERLLEFVQTFFSVKK